jgi:hypothetical protein
VATFGGKFGGTELQAEPFSASAGPTELAAEKISARTGDTGMATEMTDGRECFIVLRFWHRFFMEKCGMYTIYRNRCAIENQHPITEFARNPT